MGIYLVAFVHEKVIKLCKGHCHRIHIYTNGKFKIKAGRRNGYKYIGFGFIN